jgi:hypothetical protein
VAAHHGLVDRPVAAPAARVAVEELEVWVGRGAIWAGRCVRGLYETPGVPSSVSREARADGGRDLMLLV